VAPIGYVLGKEFTIFAEHREFRPTASDATEPIGAMTRFLEPADRLRPFLRALGKQGGEMNVRVAYQLSLPFNHSRPL
jgi:hypothetical protein